MFDRDWRLKEELIKLRHVKDKVGEQIYRITFLRILKDARIARVQNLLDELIIPKKSRSAWALVPPLAYMIGTTAFCFYAINNTIENRSEYQGQSINYHVQERTDSLTNKVTLRKLPVF